MSSASSPSVMDADADDFPGNDFDGSDDFVKSDPPGDTSKGDDGKDKKSSDGGDRQVSPSLGRVPPAGVNFSMADSPRGPSPPVGGPLSGRPSPLGGLPPFRPGGPPEHMGGGSGPRHPGPRPLLRPGIPPQQAEFRPKMFPPSRDIASPESSDDNDIRPSSRGSMDSGSLSRRHGSATEPPLSVHGNGHPGSLSADCTRDTPASIGGHSGALMAPPQDTGRARTSRWSTGPETPDGDFDHRRGMPGGLRSVDGNRNDQGQRENQVDPWGGGGGPPRAQFDTDDRNQWGEQDNRNSRESPQMGRGGPPAMRGMPLMRGGLPMRGGPSPMRGGTPGPPRGGISNRGGSVGSQGSNPSGYDEDDDQWGDDRSFDRIFDPDSPSRGFGDSRGNANWQPRGPPGPGGRGQPMPPQGPSRVQMGNNGQRGPPGLMRPQGPPQRQPGPPRMSGPPRPQQRMPGPGMPGSGMPGMRGQHPVQGMPQPTFGGQRGGPGQEFTDSRGNPVASSGYNVPQGHEGRPDFRDHQQNAGMQGGQYQGPPRPGEMQMGNAQQRPGEMPRQGGMVGPPGGMQRPRFTNAGDMAPQRPGEKPSLMPAPVEGGSRQAGLLAGPGGAPRLSDSFRSGAMQQGSPMHQGAPVPSSGPGGDPYQSRGAPSGPPTMQGPNLPPGPGRPPQYGPAGGVPTSSGMPGPSGMMRPGGGQPGSMTGPPRPPPPMGGNVGPPGGMPLPRGPPNTMGRPGPGSMYPPSGPTSDPGMSGMKPTTAPGTFPVGVMPGPRSGFSGPPSSMPQSSVANRMPNPAMSGSMQPGMPLPGGMSGAGGVSNMPGRMLPPSLPGGPPNQQSNMGGQPGAMFQSNRMPMTGNTMPAPASVSMATPGSIGGGVGTASGMPGSAPSSIPVPPRLPPPAALPPFTSQPQVSQPSYGPQANAAPRAPPSFPSLPGVPQTPATGGLQPPRPFANSQPAPFQQQQQQQQPMPGAPTPPQMQNMFRPPGTGQMPQSSTPQQQFPSQFPAAGQQGVPQQPMMPMDQQQQQHPQMQPQHMQPQTQQPQLQQQQPMQQQQPQPFQQPTQQPMPQQQPQQPVQPQLQLQQPQLPPVQQQQQQQLPLQQEKPMPDQPKRDPQEVALERLGVTPTDELWVETKTPEGKSYFYHAKTRESAWDRPSGMNIKIVTQMDLENAVRVAGLAQHEKPVTGEGQVDTTTGQPASGGDVNQQMAMSQQQPQQMQQQQPQQAMQQQPQQQQQQQQQPQQQQQSAANQSTTTGFMGMNTAASTGGARPGVPPMPMGMTGTPMMPGMPPMPAMPGFPGWPGFMPGMFMPPTAMPGMAAATTTPSVPPVPTTPAPGEPTPPKPPAPEPNPWSEHISPEGRPYYYNSATGETTWDKPDALKSKDEAETSKPPGETTAEPMESTESQVTEAESQQATEEAVATEDKTTEEQVAPEQQEESEAMEQKGAASSSNADTEAEEKKKTAEEQQKAQDKSKPVSSVPVQGTPWCVVWTGDGRVFFYNPSSRTSVWERPEELVGRPDVDKMIAECPVPVGDTKEAETKPKTTETTSKERDSSRERESAAIPTTTIIDSDSEEKEEPPPKKKKKKEGRSRKDDDEKKGGSSSKEERPIGTFDSAIEAEIRAARERASTPVEIRIKQFKEMLREKDVSAFSTWEKELHKIVFDPRYLLLTSKERKQVFDRYVKERAEEERMEKKKKVKEAKEMFQGLLEEAGLHGRASFSDFAAKYGKDSRFKGIEKMRDKETIFNDFLVEVRRREKEEKIVQREKRKVEFQEMLKEETSLTRRSRWTEVKKQFENDTRYKAIESSTSREDYFREYISFLPSSQSSSSAAVPMDVGFESESEDEEKLKEKEREMREELAKLEREKEVAESLEGHLRERDKEMEKHKYQEAEENFRALLCDLVRNCDLSWKEWKRQLRKDHRWEAAELIHRDKKEELFNDHIKAIYKKRKEAFCEMLDENSEITLTTPWKDVKKLIKDDARFTKFSGSERKVEREYKDYLAEKLVAAKKDFRILLQETRIITHKSKQMIQENEQHLKDIIAVLENDRRYLILESCPDEREKLLETYLDELDKKGPPPPPTQTEPNRRK